jgi:hypothetical protein
MNKRTFYLSALMLAIAALIAHSVARGFLTESMHRRAAGLRQAAKQQVAYSPDAKTVQATRNWHAITAVGITLTSLSVVSMITALIRHEPGWYLILTLILFFAVMTPMLL